ncbi:MAG: thiamine pyrophosphate-binding protein, partial [Deltaproteobacteria bacterium]|nr:thiamine pyrophosphate-binding protein [Deltaproteobacteria bacterium]
MSGHAGQVVARTLKAQGVGYIFTLCGGHIAPILVGCRAEGIRVIDVRHEATAVFAADASARLTGLPGVAAVTAGPGLTNSITAVKNAQLAQSPLVLLGGAAPDLLKGRGALQDIDQFALIRPHVKWAARVRRVRQAAPVVAEAFRRALQGVPGPVFVEFPVDLLYPEEVVRQWYGSQSGGGGSLGARLLNWYVGRHLDRMFAPGAEVISSAAEPDALSPAAGRVSKAAKMLEQARRPVILAGSQATLNPHLAGETAAALAALGAPVYLSGMARGLLGREHPLLFRHGRSQTLREADLVILAGVPADFRLGYGRAIPRRARLIGVNRSRADLRLNRRPDLAIPGDPGGFIRSLAAGLEQGRRANGRPAGMEEDWLESIQGREEEREAQIATQAAPASDGEGVNPLHLLSMLDRTMGEDSVIIGDGGDFVASAAYTLRPRGPLSWLDPGVFGTLGVGAGFALGARMARPDSDVWIIYGDGSLGYSLAEMDTFARHGLGVAAVVGNDASWRQIARDQVKVLGDDVGTALSRT